MLHVLYRDYEKLTLGLFGINSDSMFAGTYFERVYMKMTVSYCVGKYIRDWQLKLGCFIYGDMPCRLF